jgi:hypothetical protein
LYHNGNSTLEVRRSINAFAFPNRALEIMLFSSKSFMKLAQATWFHRRTAYLISLKKTYKGYASLATRRADPTAPVFTLCPGTPLLRWPVENCISKAAS